MGLFDFWNKKEPQKGKNQKEIDDKIEADIIERKRNLDPVLYEQLFGDEDRATLRSIGRLKSSYDESYNDTDLFNKIDYLFIPYLKKKYPNSDIAAISSPMESVFYDMQYRDLLYNCFYEIIDIFIENIYEHNHQNPFILDPKNLRNWYKFDFENYHLRSVSDCNELIFTKNRDKMYHFIVTGKKR